MLYLSLCSTSVYAPIESRLHWSLCWNCVCVGFDFMFALSLGWN